VQDILFLAIVVAYFASAALLVAGCARLLGPTDSP
jgi:hypothetical protein